MKIRAAWTTLVRIERHSGQLDELDVEGILASAERVLPRASDDIRVKMFDVSEGCAQQPQLLTARRLETIPARG